MPSVLDPSERLADVDVHDLPSVQPRSWRPWAQSLKRPHATRSPRTLRSRAMPRPQCPQTMETLLESVARQSPFLYSQIGAGL
jgi:hypothetical protein